jgi:ABC-type branched-subunit amino acid transport system ATPase component
MTTPVLKIDQLCKRFGGIVVADAIDLEIHAGEILGLIGPNGAGKSTLFNLISGVYPTDSGEVSLMGESLSGLSIESRAQRGISRTWQHMRLFPSLSVLENLVVASRFYEAESLVSLFFNSSKVKVRQEEKIERALKILERMKLGHLSGSAIGDLTFGQQKLMGLARALMNEGQLLLLDEPMAGVEGQSYDMMKELVRQEAMMGRAICVVEHNISFVNDLCSSAVFMFAGKILERGRVQDLLASKTLEALYFGSSTDVELLPKEVLL